MKANSDNVFSFLYDYSTRVYRKYSTRIAGEVNAMQECALAKIQSKLEPLKKMPLCNCRVIVIPNRRAMNILDLVISFWRVSW
jgi:hypothetical protein